MGDAGSMQAGREGLLLAVAVVGALLATASCFTTRRVPWLAAFLGGTLLLSGIPLLLGSRFLGIAGLLLFSGLAPVALLADRRRPPASVVPRRGRRLAGALSLSLGAFALLLFAALAAPWETQGAGPVAGAAALEQLGDTIATSWALPFEAAALFVPAAVAGLLLVLARERRG